LPNERLDLVIANGENAASGFGITPRLAEELLATGIEVLSGGNHIWDRKEILEFIPHEPRLLRPANFPEGSPGSGVYCGHCAQRHALRRAVPAGPRFHGAE
jgi:calcineurin-like phosphoesterase